MNEKNILYGVLGLILGILATWIFASAAVNNNHTGMMKMMGMKDMGMMGMSQDSEEHEEHHPEDAMSETMGNMMMGLEGKTADEFDRAFISGMIVHHQGAINMAEAALKNAKHQEIKDMSNAIISAQSREIDQMKEWQKQWYNK